MTRPYLIIPKLIPQPTWGGNYIANLKGWSKYADLETKKIGQSYELSSASLLSVDVLDSSDPNFFNIVDNNQINGTIPVRQLVPNINLLIKINQALGNSFQLHIKPGVNDPFWKAKPESWYFLEPGHISLGVKNEVNIGDYKKACLEIDTKMKELSMGVQSSKISLNKARKKASEFIRKINPWQYVNLYETKKYELIDLSEGAVHHSWEDKKIEGFTGNIVFEVQLEAMDDVATIRSFDQGKIQDDGSIRVIQIEDYFKHIDTNPIHNSYESLKKSKIGQQLFRTPFYSVDILEISNKVSVETGEEFDHLYVRDGAVNVKAGGVSVRATAGHSLFIPREVSNYVIENAGLPSVVLKTFID